MNRTTILTVGTSHLNATDEWGVVTALNAEAAIEKFHQVHVDLVVFTGNGPEDELKLRKLFLFHRPEIIFLQDKNDGLLSAQIKAALQRRAQENKPSFAIVDDALKNAMLPITIQ